MAQLRDTWRIREGLSRGLPTTNHGITYKCTYWSLATDKVGHVHGRCEASDKQSLCVAITAAQTRKGLAHHLKDASRH